jgi:hypothetical protein
MDLCFQEFLDTCKQQQQQPSTAATEDNHVGGNADLPTAHGLPHNEEDELKRAHFQLHLRHFLVESDPLKPLVCITSGGTQVPLEKNMVRFIDNFSQGFLVYYCGCLH